MLSTLEGGRGAAVTFSVRMRFLYGKVNLPSSTSLLGVWPYCQVRVIDLTLSLKYLVKSNHRTTSV